MAKDAMIQIAYNRKMLGRLMALYAILCVINLSMAIFLGGGSIYLALIESWPQNLLSLLGLFAAIVLAVCTPVFFTCTSTLWRSLQHNEPAIIINKTGIVDHTSSYMIGQLAWDEIQSIYPWTREHRLLPNRFFKTPIIAKNRFFVVVLKDKAYLKGSLGSNHSGSNTTLLLGKVNG